MANPHSAADREQYARRLVSAGVQANVALAADRELRALDRQATSPLDAASEARYDRLVKAELVQAGYALLEGLKQMAHDDVLWQSLAESSMQIERDDRILGHELPIRAILNHDIPAMLLTPNLERPAASIVYRHPSAGPGLEREGRHVEKPPSRHPPPSRWPPWHVGSDG